MDNVTLQSFGAAAGVLIVVYWGFQSAPSLIGAIKGDKSPPNIINTVTDTKPINELKEVVNNNTNATTKLIQFLDKSDAVREERDKQMYATLDLITKELQNTNKKVDDVYNVVNVHSTKCDATCRNAG